MKSWLVPGFALLVGCGDTGGFPDAAVPDAPPTATFSLTWSVVDLDNQPLNCNRIAATAMTVITHNKAFDGGGTQVFGCSTGMGQSQEVIAGFYDLDFELSGTFGFLARATPQRNVEIAAGTNTALTPLVFQVEAEGALALNVSSGRASGNCAAPTAGAGIDAVSIGVTRASDNMCVPLTFAISAGATRPAGTYTTTCPPTDFAGGCIDSDQTLSALDVPSGGYGIRLRGKTAGVECWINNDTIVVPPLGKTLTSTLNLAHQSMTTGCM